MKLTLVGASALALTALAPPAAFAQGPAAKPPPAPPAHVVGHNPARPAASAATKNPTGIYWDASMKRFRDKSGKMVSRADAHKAGVKGPATTPPSAKKPGASPKTPVKK